MIDTHTHIYLPEFEESADSDSGRKMVVERALAAGISRMIFPNVDLDTLPELLSIHSLFPDSTYVALGLHPTEVREDWKEKCDLIFAAGETVRPVAVGEVGMDLYWDSTYRELQKEAFGYQLEKARKKSLPVIVHQRSALDDTLDVIASMGEEAPLCVMHSFTGTAEDVERMKSAGDFYYGINGVASFKNASSLRTALHQIPLDRLLLETDSPYLAPVPFRGKRNESSYMPKVAEAVASELGISVEKLESITDENALRVFMNF